MSLNQGKCLRVQVHIDLKKRLVQGKRITIKGGESRWVNFKYERLPNFCYRCGMLSHVLKDCPKFSKNVQLVDDCLQYGVWLRGEPIRMSLKDPYKYGMEGDHKGRFWTTRVRSERTIVPTCVSGEKGEVGRDHVPKLTN